MLQELAGLFRAIVTIFYYIFAISYDLGWLIISFVMFVFNCVSVGFCAIGALLNAIQKDFLYFMGDIGVIMSDIGTTAVDGVNATVSSIGLAVEFILENFGNLITTGKLNFSIGVDNIASGANTLASYFVQFFVLIGRGVYFLITLLPNLVLYLLKLLYTACLVFGTFVGNFIRSAVDQTAQAFLLAVTRSRQVPLEAAFGVICIGLAVKHRAVLKRFGLVVSRRLAQIAWHFVVLISNKLLAGLSLIATWRSRHTHWTVPPPGIPVSHAQCHSPAKSGQRPTVDEDNNCVICRDRIKCVVLFPCRHLCLCIQCSESWTRQRSNCPMCRMNVSQRISVYT